MKKLLMTLMLAMLCSTQSYATDMTKLMEDARMDIVQPKLSVPVAKTFTYKSQKYNHLADAEEQMSAVASTLQKLGYKVLENATNCHGILDFRFKIIYLGEQPVKTQTYGSSLSWRTSYDADEMVDNRMKQMSSDPNFQLLERNVFMTGSASYKYALVYIGARQPGNKISSGKLAYNGYFEAAEGLNTALDNMQGVTVTEAAVYMGFDMNYHFKIAYID